MALASYDDLVSEITYWLVDRTDLVSRIPTYISMCEAEIYRRLRIVAMETSFSTAFATDATTLALPSDFKQFKFLYVVGNPDVSDLDEVSPGYIYKMYPNTSQTNIPQYYAITGSSIIFGPSPNTTYTVTGIYWAKLPGLSSTNQTNWFTNNACDLLLYGSLANAIRAIRDDQNIKTDYDAQFEKLINQVMAENRDIVSGGSRKVGRYIPY